MREITFFDSFAFGFNYRLLQAFQTGSKVHGENGLLESLGLVIGALEKNNLPVTRGAAYGLDAVRKKAEAMDKEAVCDEGLIREVRDAIDNCDGALDSEMTLRKAYVVTPKRFPLESLLGRPQELFGANVFGLLPDLSKFDFTQAGRCIAFELPTASAFHSTRGTEGVLRALYRFQIKKGRVDQPLWKQATDQLRAKRKGPPKPLLDDLDSIRVNFRNPTQHPEARYSMDETQDLLAACEGVVNRMVALFPK